MDDEMPANLLQIVESTTLGAGQIAACTKHIHAAVLSRSKYIDDPNFTTIHPADLELLFAEYDNKFFDGQIKKTLGTVPLHFGLSKRMTSSGGKTAHYTGGADGKQWYEISVSTTILFGCFRGDDHRPITASGIVCRDRLDALQRVMEHELVHLVEMLLWDKSSCAKPRFHSITLRFFGHTENRHQLITPKEKATVKYGIKPGMAVRFRFDGVDHKGIVNRINKRATVLVEVRQGQQYSDGKLLSRQHYLRDVDKTVFELSDKQRFGDVWTSAGQKRSPREWAQESHELCTSFVYDRAILDAVRVTPAGIELAKIDLPEPYLKAAGEHARRRIIAAGVRLAALLRGGDPSQQQTTSAEAFDFESEPTATPLVPAAAVAPAGKSATQTHWLNTKSNARHNSSCKWYGKTKHGRYCSADEGKPCGECGG